ncbi:hypothetical protein IU427_07010 [Nocardia beijingensis]|uniref:hypothetical protein n=1 Tax=Nocardia beijingensis TaxID=95162 RepID=UPI0018931885|nr:hypothetical protein [Nocardia beijingensis]MBF6464934.1 hypothetical protein [Nocardia beijingensis]
MYGTELFSVLSNCTKDPGELTTGRAHRAMQVHRDCSVQMCRVRRRARRRLVEAGVMVLDERATP